MRTVVQRVNEACVKVDGQEVSRIGKGFLVLLGIGNEDNEDDIKYMAEKIVHLRVFEDHEGKMNLSLLDIAGEILVVSQFTLFGDCRKGRRPSFSHAARPRMAQEFYELFCKKIEHEFGLAVRRGVFQAHMEVYLVNDGPVTLILDSKKLF